MLKKLIILLFATLMVFGSSWAEQEKKGVLSPAGPPAPSAQLVKVGFYPVSVYELEMGSNTYYVDMYVWMRWKGDVDPTSSIEFTNMVEEWGKQQESLLEKPKVLADGSNYKIMRVEGRFVQPFNLANYPLDQQKLSIMVEDSVNTADAVYYEVDKENSGIGSKLQIPGWSLQGWSSKTYQHDYGSSLGDDSTPSLYSAAEFSLNIERPISFFYWKLLMPLFIVLMAALASLFLSPTNIDARTGLPAGALLTAIFLQKSYSDGLPDLGYLILMDQIYLVAYTLIVATLIRAIYSFQKASDASTTLLKKMARSDRLILFILLSTFVMAATVLVLIHQ
ncbi:MAG: hypothetical protein U1C47_19385 [Hydrogenophaga sp.]|jgi:hypothetical protein|nr:hypothetical protein [Hydrogenophaga sp.]